MEEIKEQIERDLKLALSDNVIDCPDCESMYSDDQYTCTTCWSEGGQGKLTLLESIEKLGEIKFKSGILTFTKS